MIDVWNMLTTNWSGWLPYWADAQVIAGYQATRLTRLVELARSRSRLYSELYQDLPRQITDLRQLPPVDKPRLMEHFADWATDPQVRWQSVTDFIHDPQRIGHAYLGRYAAWTTSGTSGTPGIFLHDSDALQVYDTLMAARGWANWMRPELALRLWHGERMAFVVATNGHFAGIATWERLHRWYPWLADSIRILSVLTPLPELVAALNRQQPAAVLAYPSALLLLAQEQLAGRLAIRPATLISGGEWLAPCARNEIEQAFGCPTCDIYGASEFMPIAFGCRYGQLHLNADWIILEPVDADYQPVPVGTPSATVLLTNLANKIQPLLRYDLGDSVTVSPEPCRCGNRLPAIRVEGRRDEILYLRAPDGALVPLLPMALTSVVETIPGMRGFQIIQTSPLCLEVRCATLPGADPNRLWRTVTTRLTGYLQAQGLPTVKVQRATDPPAREPISGKQRLVWSRSANCGQAADNRRQSATNGVL